MSRTVSAEMLNIIFIYLLDGIGATMLHAAEQLSERQRYVALLIGRRALGMVKSLRIRVFPLCLAAWHSANATMHSPAALCRLGNPSSGFGACIPQHDARSRSPPQRGARGVEAGVEAAQKGVLRWRHVSELDAS